jgi:hypothetical protein
MNSVVAPWCSLTRLTRLSRLGRLGRLGFASCTRGLRRLRQGFCRSAARRIRSACRACHACLQQRGNTDGTHGTGTDTSPGVAIQMTDGRMSSKIRPKGERPERPNTQRNTSAEGCGRFVKDADEDAPGQPRRYRNEQGSTPRVGRRGGNSRTAGRLGSEELRPERGLFAAERRELGLEIARLKAELEKARTIVDVPNRVAAAWPANAESGRDGIRSGVQTLRPLLYWASVKRVGCPTCPGAECTLDPARRRG